jgi:serine/threonine-protein kinase RsbW
MSLSRLQITIPNGLAEISGVVDALHNFSLQYSLSNEVDFALQLAAEEVLSNIILYGFPNGGSHTILMDVHTNGNKVSMLVQDEGIPFNPLEQAPPKKPQTLEEMKIGGLGIHLVRNSMDEISYSREDGRNKLYLTKRL